MEGEVSKNDRITLIIALIIILTTDIGFKYKYMIISFIWRTGYAPAGDVLHHYF